MKSDLAHTTNPATVIEQGRSDYVIVVGSDADPVEQFAAEELQKYLEQMTGVTLPISADPATIPAHYISIGQTQIAVEAHFCVRPRHRFDDGFIIRNRQGNLLIQGACTRGTLFAIYALLEKWGCRWFAPDFAHYEGHHELVPTVETVAFHENVWIERPAFELRAAYIETFATDDPVRDMRAVGDWLAKVRKNCWRIDQHVLFDFREVYPGKRADHYREGAWEAVVAAKTKRDLVLAVGGHGYFTFLQPKVYFEEHPEWFALIEGERKNRGQFCISNAEARRTYVDNVMEFVREHPQIDIFIALANDGLGWCECDACAAMGSVLNQYLRVFNELAVAMERYNPELIVQALFYVETATAPDEQTQIHSSNTMGWYCNFSRDWRYPLDYEPPGLVKADYPLKTSPYWVKWPERNYAYWSVINKWLSDFYNFRMMVEEHYRKYKFSSYPCIKPHLMALDFPRYREIGIADICVNYMEPKDWYSYEPTHYFHARLAWDPYQDIDAALADYAETRYPGAGPEMVSYLSNIEEGFNQFPMPHTYDYPLPDLERALAHFASAGEALAAALEKASDPGTRFLLEKNLKSLRYARDGVSIWYLAKTGKKQEAIATGEDLLELLKENLNEGLFYYEPGRPWMLPIIETYLDTLRE